MGGCPAQSAHLASLRHGHAQKCSLAGAGARAVVRLDKLLEGLDGGGVAQGASVALAVVLVGVLVCFDDFYTWPHTLRLVNLAVRPCVQGGGARTVFVNVLVLDLLLLLAEGPCDVGKQVAVSRRAGHAGRMLLRLVQDVGRHAAGIAGAGWTSVSWVWLLVKGRIGDV